MNNPITQTTSPCVILAGAGTGKTHTIVEKIKYLIQNKIYKPEKIVCITFSNEACNSLLSRVRKSLPPEEKEPVIKTFHAFSADLLRENQNKNFNILTPDEAKIILHANLKVPAGNCHKYIHSIGIAKDLGITLDSLEEYLNFKTEKYKNINLEKRLETLQFELQTLHLKRNDETKRELLDSILKLKHLIDLRKFINCWKAYEKIKKIKNYQDYSDLNKNTLTLLKQNPEIAKNYDYIVVDEFQDTNKIQLDLLKYLAPHKNITVVGDLNQSIYRFRGAYKENYKEFKKSFNVPQENIFNLDRSFRSPNKVLRTAHKLIQNNYKNKNEPFMVENAQDREGPPIEVHQLKDSKEEARKVVELIQEQTANNVPPEEICVLFRTHQQGRIIKRLLDSEKIPYCAVTKNSLLKQKSVKTIINYLDILNNLRKRSKGGEQAWWDLVYHLDFSESDLIKIGGFIKQNRNCENINAKLLSNLQDLKISQTGKMKLKILLERIKRLIPLANKPVQEFLPEAYNLSGLLPKDKSKETKEVLLNLNKFLELAKNHSNLYSPDLESFIHYLDVINSLNLEIEASELEDQGVRLMTLHATKGLEYKTVIITNIAQKRFPAMRFTSNNLIPLELYPDLNHRTADLSEQDLDYFLQEYEKQNQLFEERRLCYVAFTRAKEKLILTYANKYGNKRFFPSQFLQEINFQENPDIKFLLDFEERYIEPQVEIKKALELSPILKKDNFEELLKNSIQFSESVKEKQIEFSPSALLTFDECQKKYEYKYKYNMPEEKTIYWEALRLGSFVHEILEKGVHLNFKTAKEFTDLAKELCATENWESVDFEEAEHLIKVFFERNKNKYNINSKTEQLLKTQLRGLKFTGFADRIDFNPDGLEIIDYKTGKSSPFPKNRNWQLGYYALAAHELGKVKKITLDMLRHEKPLEFNLDENGTARSEFGRMEFNIHEVKEELVETANKILEAYKTGFKPCPIEKNCEFCDEYFYS